MKILILCYADVANTIGATLPDRASGHLVRGGYVDEKTAQGFIGYDGCLLLGEEAELVELAGFLKDRGKMVWREWTDIPPTQEWPRVAFLPQGVMTRDRSAQPAELPAPELCV